MPRLDAEMNCGVLCAQGRHLLERPYVPVMMRFVCFPPLRIVSTVKIAEKCTSVYELMLYGLRFEMFSDICQVLILEQQVGVSCLRPYVERCLPPCCVH